MSNRDEPLRLPPRPPSRGPRGQGHPIRSPREYRENAPPDGPSFGGTLGVVLAIIALLWALL